MQLKQKSIRAKLAAATSTLLLTTPLQSNAENPETLGKIPAEPSTLKEDDVSFSGLYYSEQDRVEVFKAQTKYTKTLNDDNIVRVGLILDTMSGASPNGRIYSESENDVTKDTVSITTASGFEFDTVNDSEDLSRKTWLTEFEDFRTAASLEWEHEVTSNFTSILGGGISYEDDYESYTASINTAFEFNRKLTTLNLGAAIANDTVKAGGGIPEGLGRLTSCEQRPASYFPLWLDCDKDPDVHKPAEKIVTDYLVGVTQVWNRRTLFQVNYALGVESGYLTDPYKQISVTKAGFGESAVLYEKRPDTRTTNSLFFKFVHVPVDNISLNGSYRYFWDDWEVNSHTLDGKLRYNFNNNIYIQGHGRLYTQSAAFFFDKQISADFGHVSYYAEKPKYISADSRLSKLIGATAGVKIGVKIGERFDIAVRAEHLQQHYYNGVLPRMKVWIAQLILKLTL